MIFSFLFAFLYEQEKRREIKIFFIVLSFLCMWIPAAIREGIGTDYYNYINYLHQVEGGIPNVRTEIGFYLILKIIAFFNLNSQWLFVITSFLTVLFVFLSIKKYFSLSILFYNILLLDLYSYNIVKQGLAVAIVMYAVSNLIDGHKLKYIIFVLLASSVHMMSLLCLPFVFFYKINYKIIITVGIIILVFISSIDIVSLILKIPMIGERYGIIYFFNSVYGVEQESSIWGFFARFIPGVLILLFSRNFLIKRPEYGSVVIMVLIYLCAALLRLRYFIFYRLVQFFLFPLVFMIPVLFDSIRKNNIFNTSVRYVVIIVIILLSIASYEAYITRETSTVFGIKNVVPYSSIFH